MWTLLGSTSRGSVGTVTHGGPPLRGQLASAEHPWRTRPGLGSSSSFLKKVATSSFPVLWHQSHEAAHLARSRAVTGRAALVGESHPGRRRGLWPRGCGPGQRWPSPRRCTAGPTCGTADGGLQRHGNGLLQMLWRGGRREPKCGFSSLRGVSPASGCGQADIRASVSNNSRSRGWSRC